jgi:uncharacterized protein (TIGR03083 family)
MDTDTVWRHVRAEREALVGTLRELSEEEWEHPSLCAGWRVRDVAGHLTAVSLMRPVDLPVMLARGRFSYNGMILRDGQRRGRAPVEQILADHERLAGVRRHPPMLTPLEPLTDILVHTQDILRPLGREYAAPVDTILLAADRVRRMALFLGSRRIVGSVRMVATDADWVRGDGPTIEAPMRELLMICAGRAPDLALVSGDGLEMLRA